MKISIALCTYNGARFLAGQLQSIASQTRLPDELVACDDVSSDGTIAMLEEFASRVSFPVRIIRNPSNLGAIANFQQAINLCTGTLTALADQDDVWLPDKLRQAEQAFLDCSDPESALYCTRLQYVDSDLKPLGLSGIPGNTYFSNAVVENSATGCSVVFGSEIKRRFLQANPSHMVMHDWWLYLLATAFGKVIYDARQSVLYRQHDSNVAGWKPRLGKLLDRYSSLRARLKTGREGMDSLNQAALFIATYQDLAAEKRQVVSELIELRKSGVFGRLRYSMQPKVARNDLLENIALRFFILMGWH